VNNSKADIPRRHLAVHPLETLLAGTPCVEPKYSTCIILLASGRLYLKLQDGNRLVAGPVLLISAPGGIVELRADKSTRGDLLAADPDMVSILLSPFLQAIDLSHLISNNNFTVIPLSRTEAAAGEESMKEIRGETETRRPGWRESATLLLGKMMIGAARSLDDELAPRRKPLSIEDLPVYLTEHYSDDFNLEGLALLCKTSPAQLSREFKKITGHPLFSFINDIRIEKSCTLLKRSSMTVLEISFAVGYNNVSFYNRYFRKLMGTSPAEYRKLAKN
jgi:AraC-like DNA-binding protein